MELIVEHQGYFMSDTEKIYSDKDLVTFHNELLVKILKELRLESAVVWSMALQAEQAGSKLSLNLTTPYLSQFQLIEGLKQLIFLENYLKDLLSFLNAVCQEENYLFLGKLNLAITIKI